MLNKAEIIKEIAEENGKLYGNEILGFIIEAPYYKDVSIVLKLAESDLTFTRSKSKDFETFFYNID